MMNKSMQQEQTKKQQTEIEQFYRAKYPNSIGAAEAHEPEIRLSAQDRQDANQAFSDGIYRANQAQNAETLAKLADAFKSRREGK